MPRPLRGQQQPTLYMCTKFEKRLRNIESVAKFRNWVMSPRPGPLRGNLQSVNKNCLSVCLYVCLLRGYSETTAQIGSVIMRHLKCVALSATKIWHIFFQTITDDVTLIFDLLTLKVVSELHVTWATSVPILVILGLSVLDIGPMYATDRQTGVRQTDRRQTASSLNAPPREAGA